MNIYTNTLLPNVLMVDKYDGCWRYEKELTETSLYIDNTICILKEAEEIRVPRVSSKEIVDSDGVDCLLYNMLHECSDTYFKDIQSGIKYLDDRQVKPIRLLCHPNKVDELSQNCFDLEVVSDKIIKENECFVLPYPPMLGVFAITDKEDFWGMAVINSSFLARVQLS